MTVRTLLGDLGELDFEVLAWSVRVEGVAEPIDHVRLDLGTRQFVLVPAAPPSKKE